MIPRSKSATMERTVEKCLKGVSKLRFLILIMLAIIRGGAWE
jgi:hypothetical protein